MELQGALKINDSLKKEVDELQRFRAGLLEENEQLKDFKTFFISPEDLLAFTFKASIGEVVREADAQAEVARGKAPDAATAKDVEVDEGVATE
ncbi:hypothetical protein PS2_022721 [Malus domestica]